MLTFLGIIFVIAVYVAIAALGRFAGNIYENGAIVHFNDIAKNGFDGREINECQNCSYLFSNYYMFRRDAKIYGCPNCGQKHCIESVYAKIFSKGNWLLFTERNYWKRIER